MKYKSTFLILAAAIILLSGCGAKPSSEGEHSSPSETEDITQSSGIPELPRDAENEKNPETSQSPGRNEENINIEISPYAKEHYLAPLEDYSWEREFPAEYVMLHFTSNIVADRKDPYELSSVRRIFEQGGVSIHYIIDRGGSVYCYIPETRDAWHAGKGEFAGDGKYTNKMNKYSIGIELLAVGSQSDMAQYLTKAEYDALDREIIGFTDEQYGALRVLVKDICERNGIPFDRSHVIGHEEYNPSKSDPGQLFEWDRVFDLK